MVWFLLAETKNPYGQCAQGAECEELAWRVLTASGIG